MTHVGKKYCEFPPFFGMSGSLIKFSMIKKGDNKYQKTKRIPEVKGGTSRDACLPQPKQISVTRNQYILLCQKRVGG